MTGDSRPFALGETVLPSDLSAVQRSPTPVNPWRLPGGFPTPTLQDSSELTDLASVFPSPIYAKEERDFTNRSAGETSGINENTERLDSRRMATLSDIDLERIVAGVKRGI